MRTVNLVGQKFGKLTVIKESEPHVYPSGRQRKTFLCQCECGAYKTALQNALVTGQLKSCGCWKSIPENNVKYRHGLSRHPISAVWGDMKNRCNNPKCQYYHVYGARGIKVCDEWANDFKVFYDWAIAKGWKKGLHIDRIDSNKGYSPDNCRFVTPKENMNNRRSNITIGICGEFKTLTQWCEALGIERKLAYSRFNRTGDIFLSLDIS